MISSAEPFFNSRSSIRRSIEVIATYAIANTRGRGKRLTDELISDGRQPLAKSLNRRSGGQEGIEVLASGCQSNEASATHQRGSRAAAAGRGRRGPAAAAAWPARLRRSRGTAPAARRPGS